MKTAQRESLLYRSGVDKCKAAGVELDPDDYIAIWKAAKYAIEGDASLPAFVECPVQVGNVTLHPRTLGAGLWWDECGAKWFGDSPVESIVAMSWMLANSRNQIVFRLARVKAVAVALIVAFQFKLAANITPAELGWGIKRLFDHKTLTAEGQEVDSVSSLDWGSVIARLCATYHMPAEHFIWGMSEDAALQLIGKAPSNVPGGSRNTDRDDAERYCHFTKTVKALIEEKGRKDG